MTLSKARLTLRSRMAILHAQKSTQVHAYDPDPNNLAIFYTSTIDDGVTSGDWWESLVLTMVKRPPADWLVFKKHGFRRKYTGHGFYIAEGDALSSTLGEAQLFQYLQGKGGACTYYEREILRQLEAGRSLPKAGRSLPAFGDWFTVSRT